MAGTIITVEEDRVRICCLPDLSKRTLSKNPVWAMGIDHWLKRQQQRPWCKSFEPPPASQSEHWRRMPWNSWLTELFLEKPAICSGPVCPRGARGGETQGEGRFNFNCSKMCEAKHISYIFMHIIPYIFIYMGYIYIYKIQIHHILWVDRWSTV